MRKTTCESNPMGCGRMHVCSASSGEFRSTRKLHSTAAQTGQLCIDNGSTEACNLWPTLDEAAGDVTARKTCVRQTTQSPFRKCGAHPHTPHDQVCLYSIFD